MQLSRSWQIKGALLMVASLASLSLPAMADKDADKGTEKKDTGAATTTREVTTGSEKSLMDKADAAFDSGDMKGAIDGYSQIVAANPKNADALANRGLAKFYEKDYLGAMADANEAIKYSPTWGYPFYVRGRCQLSLNDYKKATAEFTKCLQLQDFKNAYLYRGQANYKLKDYSPALADLNQVINKDEKNWDAYYWRYWVYSAIKSLDDARQDAETLVKLQPKWADSFRCLAYVNEDQGKVPEAITAYKQAAELYKAENDTADEQKMLENIAYLEKGKKEASTK
jgi:tetratricopeptide (TPR) repeat protein